MVDTTVMKNSKVGDAWIKQACEANPVQPVLNNEGLPTGNWLTGPVRLVFCDSLFKAKPQMRTDPNSALKHSTGILLTPWTNMDPFWAEYYRVAATDFPEFWNAAMGQYVGIDNPITDQGFKAHKYGGFTPGLFTTTMASQYKPPIVDTRLNPIVDESKVYAGVWAIISFNTYASGKKFPRKGPRFGLQSLVIIGDDERLDGGGAVDPRSQFGAIKVAPPAAIPAGAFGGPGMQPPGARPASPPATAYYPPGGYQAQPHLPRPAGHPPVTPPVADDEDISQFT